ncbi:unnamed protein product [Paramecium sonneborni]|uniref:Uncharacterized protein n=1 Tax=Paramecium sonneborni TaxID=65129 RepID=A0A8S1LJF6_9CILI|nr:unnamed protein product [Paramecium sonneborni]
MYNRPSSKTRYQQEATIDSINLKEKQLYLQSSSINPLTGAILRPDQSYNQQQYNNSNFDKKIALQASSINPLTGAPLARNPISYQSESIQQKQYTPYGVQSNQAGYATSAGQIGSGGSNNNNYNNNDAQFQKNLIKFFAADDPNQIQPKQHTKSTNSIPSDPQFQKNLVKFFAADDPSMPNRSNHNIRQTNSRSNNNYQQSIQPQYQPQSRNQNDQQFQQNLNKFFAADDPTQIKKPVMQKQSIIQSQQQSQPKYQQFNEAPPDPRLVSDPNFQKNLNKFFATDDPSQPKKQVSKQSLQQQQISAIEQNKLQRLEQDPRFQKNLQQFFGLDGISQQHQNAQYGQGNIQQQNKSIKVLAITDSSSIARNQVAAFFRTRGIDDFDVFTNPGGVFGLQNNTVQEQSLKYYLDTMSNAYNIKEIYIVSVLDNSSNAKIYTSTNDKRSHQIAIQDLKTVLENKFNVQYKLHGIIIDQRGASEKAF